MDPSAFAAAAGPEWAPPPQDDMAMPAPEFERPMTKEEILDEAAQAVQLTSCLPATTKLAIMAALCPDRSETDVNDFRRLVSNAKAAPIFTMPSQTTPKYLCPVCGNRDQGRMVHEAKGGDVVCTGADGEGCGTVVEEHKMFEGNQYRKFEGEEDKSHHGPAPNRFYSAAHNMKTTVAPGGAASGKRAALLRAAADQMEMGLSNLGTDEKKTREGYKDQMKKKAFDRIAHVVSNLALHESVVNRAQELFANFRDEREYVQKFDAVVAACVIQAAEESAKTALLGRGEDEPSAKPPPPPAYTTTTGKLLARPLASLERTEAPAAKRTRAGKGWLDALDELGEEEEDDDS